MDDFTFYNRHYITVDDRGRITDAWSDGPHPEKEVTGAICINERGGYQLRLIVDRQQTEENPALYDMDGVPLYKWDGAAVQRRTMEEIVADRAAIPPAPPSEQERVRADIDYLAAMAGVEL